MKAMLLAAGRGTRVLPLTESVPKPMLPLLGRPVMEWLIEHLARHGFDEIMLNTSYLGPQIEDYFRDGAKWGVQIGYSFEGYLEGSRLVDRPVGSAGALRLIQDHSGFFDATTLVVCADALWSLDLGRFLAFHRERRALATIALTTVPDHRVSDYGVVVTGADGRIEAFQEKPPAHLARSRSVNTGIYLFEPEVIDRIPSGATYDIGSQLFPALVAERAAFFGSAWPFAWHDIGSVRDYYAVSMAALHGSIAGVRLDAPERRPGVRAGLNVRADWDRCRIAGPVMIGSGARLEPGCTIVGPAWIGRGVTVEAGAAVVRSIVGDYTRVGRNTLVMDCIASPTYCVDCDGQARSTDGLGDARARVNPPLTAGRAPAMSVAA